MLWLLVPGLTYRVSYTCHVPCCRYMLSILTFISKCTGVVEAEFEDMIQNEAG
jgi:hypothetical protein